MKLQRKRDLTYIPCWYWNAIGKKNFSVSHLKLMGHENPHQKSVHGNNFVHFQIRFFHLDQFQKCIYLIGMLFNPVMCFVFVCRCRSKHKIYSMLKKSFPQNWNSIDSCAIHLHTVYDASLSFRTHICVCACQLAQYRWPPPVQYWFFNNNNWLQLCSMQF